MRPTEVLDRLTDLVSRMEEEQFRDAMTAPITADLVVLAEAPEKEAQRAAAEFMEFAQRNARYASAYHVTYDMCLLLEHAARGLDDEDKFDRDLAPTPFGFVRFDKPISMGHYEGRETTVNWLLWGPFIDGRTQMLWFAEFGHDPFSTAILKHVSRAEAMARLGKWVMLAWDSYGPGHPMGPPTIKRVSAKTALMFGNLDEVEDTDWDESNDARLVHALWLMLNQTVTVTYDAQIDRPARRRAMRKGLPGKVTVIQLRRSAGLREPGHSEVEWQHRWIVRGHWRWQACGVGRKERRRIWIDPFEKGPEGAPLKVTDKVYDWRR